MKPTASLSLDLDNKWSYMKTHGDPGWDSFPSYFDLVVPRILEFLSERRLSISFFVVGQDAALEKNARSLGSIAEAGHEIANHSFNHEPWLHLYNEQKLNEELELAETHIERVTGVRPTGFRGPGFSLSENTLKVLAQRGYEYDATVFPNLLNPLARAYFFATSNLTAEEREQRKALFGTWKDALRPVKSFRWKSTGNENLLEIPVTTMPLFKVPIHLSYVLYLSKYSKSLALIYFRTALALCKLTRTEPSILLHPLDFIGREEAEELKFFPGMDIATDKKLFVVDKCLHMLASGHDVVTMREHASRIGTTDGTRTIEPHFSV